MYHADGKGKKCKLNDFGKRCAVKSALGLSKKVHSGTSSRHTGWFNSRQRQEFVPFVRNVQTGCEVHAAFYWVGKKDAFQRTLFRGKGPGRVVNVVTLIKCRGRNKWSFTSTYCVFMTCTVTTLHRSCSLGGKYIVIELNYTAYRMLYQVESLQYNRVINHKPIAFY